MGPLDSMRRSLHPLHVRRIAYAAERDQREQAAAEGLQPVRLQLRRLQSLQQTELELQLTPYLSK
jgi:hypothetical protein